MTSQIIDNLRRARTSRAHWVYQGKGLYHRGTPPVKAKTRPGGAAILSPGTPAGSLPRPGGLRSRPESSLMESLNVVMRFVLLACLCFGAAIARAQPVQIDVRQTGFASSSISGHVGRAGSWMPLLVELTTAGSQARQVSLRCVTADIDGDLVAYTETPIVLTPNAPPRRVWLYAIPGQARSLRVDVLSMEGQTLASSLDLDFERVSADYQVLVDLSAKQLSALTVLDAGGDYFGQQPSRDYARNRCVARLAAGDLPDRWYGLEAADILVWDAPETMPTVAQQDALLKWIERGGQLVLGIGPAWDLLDQSRLRPLLPYVGNGDLIEVAELPRLAAQTRSPEDRRFDRPIPLNRLERAPDAQVLLRDEVEGRPHDLVAMKTFGSGRVIATTARIRDLLTGLNESALRKTLPLFLDLTPLRAGYLEDEASRFSGIENGYRVRDPVLMPTEFRGQASILVLLAFVFVGVYVLAATWASWGWLRSRGMTQASWVVFAGCAVVASLLSVGAVQVIRGTSDAVQTFALVDLEAGSSAARARVWVGYRSARGRKVDLRLDAAEGSDSFLRGAVPVPTEDVSYETPERYAAEVTRGLIRGAPLRATLKQFEGYWEGTIQGRIRGELVAERGTGKLLPESFVVNDTDRQFEIGYLLYTDPRLTYLSQVAARPAGPHNRNRYWGADAYPPAVNILAVEIGRLNPGATLQSPGAEEYETYDVARRNWLTDQNRKPDLEPKLRTLWHQQNLVWANTFRPTPFGERITPTAAAALLYVTQNLYLPNRAVGSFDKIGIELTTDLLPRGADITHLVRGGDQGQAVLLLYSPQPAAPQLVRGGSPLPARRGAALYRVRIPIRWK